MRHKILFKYPTRGRPEWFKRTLEKYYSLLSGKYPFQFIVTLDKDDKTMNNQEMKKYLDSQLSLMYFYGNNRTKIEAINADMKYNDWTILFLVSDDMEPVIRNFDVIIVETMNKHFPDLDGALHFNDGCCGKDKLITLSILGKKLYENFGYIYHPSYRSEWCDTEFTDVVYALKKVVYCPITIVKHTWTGGKNTTDSTYKKNNLLVPQDRENYRKRKFLPLQRKINVFAKR